MAISRAGTALFTSITATAFCSSAWALPRPDHVVVVMEENHAYSEVIGQASAPYINSLANGGALFSNSHGIEHPSQPNYLDLFSGSNQGTTNSDTTPGNLPFNTANLGDQLLSAGFTFKGYSETMPSVGYTGDSSGVFASGLYERKHNPWVNWQDDTTPRPATHIPSTLNQPYTSFPNDFSLLPTISFVIPNQQHDMHDGTVAQGDTWLQSNLSSYATWAKANNSLLVVQWDEDDNGPNNQIPTIFYGAPVKTGTYGEAINHYSVLRTLEDMYGLPYAGSAATATPITDTFVVPEPVSAGGLFVCGLLLFNRGRPTRRRSC